MSTRQNNGFATRAIHHAYDPAEHQGALVPPLHLSATFAFPSVEYGAQCFAGEAPGFIYSRIANPTLQLLEQRIATLEQAQAAVAFGSGMGAITATLWTLLSAGDEILVDTTLYGCTFSFLNHGLSRFGVTVRHVDMTRPDELRMAIGPRSKVVYFETPANPNLRLVDIEAVSSIAHAAGATVVVDNTFCSPYLQRPRCSVFSPRRMPCASCGLITAPVRSFSPSRRMRPASSALQAITPAVRSPCPPRYFVAE